MSMFTKTLANVGMQAAIQNGLVIKHDNHTELTTQGRELAEQHIQVCDDCAGLFNRSLESVELDGFTDEKKTELAYTTVVAMVSARHNVHTLHSLQSAIIAETFSVLMTIKPLDPSIFETGCSGFWDNLKKELGLK